jgi:hypothetical protein
MNPHVANLPWSFGIFDWMAASAPETVSASKADSACRPIATTSFLEDPRARTAHVWVRPPNQSEFRVDVEGVTVDIWVNTNPEGFVHSLLSGTHATSPREGVSRCVSATSCLLSSWSFQCQRPMAVREWMIEDRLHHAKWVIRPQAQAPLKLNEIDVALAPANPIGSLVALFREGMASIQPAYRFLCYYKIIEAWNAGLGPFWQVNQTFQARGRQPDRRILVIGADMFQGKVDFDRFSHLVGRKFSRCFQEMNGARKFLAHPFSTEGAFVSLDSPDTQGQLADLANLAERMAIEIIVEEIRIVGSLDDTGTTARIVKSYIHDSWGNNTFERVS